MIKKSGRENMSVRINSGNNIGLSIERKRSSFVAKKILIIVKIEFSTTEGIMTAKYATKVGSIFFDISEETKATRRNAIGESEMPDVPSASIINPEASAHTIEPF